MNQSGCAIRDTCKKKPPSDSKSSEPTSGPVPTSSPVRDDIESLTDPYRSFIKSPSGHRYFFKKGEQCDCPQTGAPNRNTQSSCSFCVCPGGSGPSKNRETISSESRPPAQSHKSQARILRCVDCSQSDASFEESNPSLAPLPPRMMSETQGSLSTPHNISYKIPCTDPHPGLKAPEISEECQCDGALYNEFVYYCAALRLLIPAMSKMHSKENVVHWLARLCEPGCGSVQHKENRNSYLFALLVNVINDESFGWFSRPPYEDELQEYKDMVRYHTPKCGWETDKMWEEIIESLPKDLLSECTCGDSSCKAPKEISRQLDDEFRFFLHLTRPYVDYLADPEAAAILGEWIQYLCSFTTKVCDSRKSNRNSFMMALYGCAAELKLKGPFKTPPDWTQPLPKLSDLMEDTNAFLESQPVPAQGIFAFLTAIADTNSPDS